MIKGRKPHGRVSRRLNSSVGADYGAWSVDQIRGTIDALKSKAAAFNCTLRVTSSEIRLSNKNDDFFSATLGDDWSVERVEFNMSGSAVRGDLSELGEITERAFAKLEALNELKQSWKEISQWLELLAYAKKTGINASRRKLNSSVNYDYDGEETDDGYFEGSVEGTCPGLSAKYADYSNPRRNYQFCKDVSEYITTAADITFAVTHDDTFQVDISAEDESEFEDTVAEVIEFIKFQNKE